MTVPVVTVTELKSELAGDDPPILVDVREDFELEISALPGIIHIEMDEIPSRMSELDQDSNLVIVCRTGNRSGHVTAFLLQQGFKRVRNLSGGMNDWASRIDRSMRTY